MLGELLHAVLPIPIPAAIYGLVLLFLALMLGVVKLPQVDAVSKFLIATMGVLFVAPGVSIMEVWGDIASSAVAIVVISVASTLLVFAVSGVLTQLLMGKGEKDHG